MSEWWAMGAVAAIVAAGGVVRGSLLRRVAPKPQRDKLQSYDFRARTRPGFYRFGSVVIRIDQVGWRRPEEGQPVRPSDWRVWYTGQDPYTFAPNYLSMPLHRLTSAWRKEPEKRIAAKWLEWFGMHGRPVHDIDDSFNIV